MPWCPKQKVIVPVDFSDEAFTALSTALELAENPERVLVVHVLQDLSPMGPGEMWGTVDRETRIRHTTNALRERLAQDGHGDLATDVVLGDPGHEIADLAKREKADLIVLTSHGRTGLRHLLIGSVAERIIRLAHCPVLVLRK